MIITEGNKTLVDHTDYNLSFDGAIQQILVGKDIYAQPFGYPDAELIKAEWFTGKSYQEIGNHLSNYERFAKV